MNRRNAIIAFGIFMIVWVTSGFRAIFGSRLASFLEGYADAGVSPGHAVLAVLIGLVLWSVVFALRVARWRITIRDAGVDQSAFRTTSSFLGSWSCHYVAPGTQTLLASLSLWGDSGCGFLAALATCLLPAFLDSAFISIASLAIFASYWDGITPLWVLICLVNPVACAALIGVLLFFKGFRTSCSRIIRGRFSRVVGLTAGSVASELALMAALCLGFPGGLVDRLVPVASSILARQAVLMPGAGSFEVVGAHLASLRGIPTGEALQTILGFRVQFLLAGVGIGLVAHIFFLIRLVLFFISPRRMKSETPAVLASKEDEVASLVDELIQIGRHVEDRDPPASGYLRQRRTAEASRHPRARAIGVRLDEIGGFAMMSEACRRVEAELGPLAALELNHCWHEVGHWLA